MELPELPVTFQNRVSKNVGQTERTGDGQGADIPGAMEQRGERL